MSIFSEYYSNHQFFDRFTQNPDTAIDVIIPVYHTNELWRVNLMSIYREVPVKRLLISDGGVIDDSIDIVKQFPRVEVFNHRHYKSLGKCIAELIKEVKADWFAYLHSDVYLPPGWFENMMRHKESYDWYGCPMNITVMVNYKVRLADRPYAGSQIGRKLAFDKFINRVDDDYVYRQEDFVFNRIVEDAGFKTGKIEDTFHYHQLMFRTSKGFDVNVRSVHVDTVKNEAERKRANETQIRGIVKYLDPVEPYMINDFKVTFRAMIREKELKYLEFRKWVRMTNIRWLPYTSWWIYLPIWWGKTYEKILHRLSMLTTKKK